MALDNNHVTKLGELKQLIDGLWGKVTTAISNAVSGLLSKSEADTYYATAEQGAKADTALQSYTETDPVFSASAAAGITSDDIANWNAGSQPEVFWCKYNVTTYSEVVLAIEAGKLPVVEIKEGNEDYSDIKIFVCSGRDTSRVGPYFDFVCSQKSGSDYGETLSYRLFLTPTGWSSVISTEYAEVSRRGAKLSSDIDITGNAATATSATNAGSLNTQTIASSSTAVYGAYVGDLISNFSSSFSEATLFVELSLAGAYKSMQYMLHIERRGAGEFSASLVEIGNRQYGFPNDVSCKIAYKRESDYSSSSNGISKWYIILIDNNGNDITKNYVRISFARIFINNSLFEPKFEFLTSVPGTTSYYQARFAPQTYITANKGSSTNPVFIDESGLVTACSFNIVIGSTGTDTSTLYFY